MKKIFKKICIASDHAGFLLKEKTGIIYFTLIKFKGIKMFGQQYRVNLLLPLVWLQNFTELYIRKIQFYRWFKFS